MNINDFTHKDKKGRELNIEDQIIYCVADNTLQIGRIRDLREDGVVVIGQGNKREGLIKNSESQVWLHKKGYYKNHKGKRA